MFSLIFVCEPAVEILIFSNFFLWILLYAETLLEGPGSSRVTLRYSPDHVPCLRDRQHNNLSGSPLALMEKSSLALQTQTAEGPCSAVLCCWAWVRVTIRRLKENCWSSVAEELHGASHGLSSLAMSICFLPIIFRTGSQKWIWKTRSWMNEH